VKHYATAASAGSIKATGFSGGLLRRAVVMSFVSSQHAPHSAGAPQTTTHPSSLDAPTSTHRTTHTIKESK
jgi:hypothetical protein